jgi:hypothetical protein
MRSYSCQDIGTTRGLSDGLARGSRSLIDTIAVYRACPTGIPDEGSGGEGLEIRSPSGGDFCTFELMRASAERPMSCLFQAGLAAGGAASTALGLIGRASGAGGGVAFGPAACVVPAS